MPADTLTSQTQPMTLHVLDEEIHAHYYPMRITGADLRLLKRTGQVFSQRGSAAGDADVALDALDEGIAMFVRVIATWDFPETKDGPLVPLTVERLSQFGPYVQAALIGAFVRGLSLGETTGNGLQARSRRTTSSRSRKSSKRS